MFHPFSSCFMRTDRETNKQSDFKRNCAGLRMLLWGFMCPHVQKRQRCTLNSNNYTTQWFVSDHTRRTAKLNFEDSRSLLLEVPVTRLSHICLCWGLKRKGNLICLQWWYRKFGKHLLPLLEDYTWTYIINSNLRN